MNWPYYQRYRRKLLNYRYGFVRYIPHTLVIFIIVLISYLLSKRILRPYDLTLLAVEKCPACFGLWPHVCNAFRNGDIKVRDNYIWESEWFKGVWYGEWNDKAVVVKTLTDKNERKTFDDEICRNLTMSWCKPGYAVYQSFLNPNKPFKSSVMQFMDCHPEQFPAMLEKHYGRQTGSVGIYQKIMIIASLYLNQEFVFLEIFSRRFPNFLPKLYGACGRAIVVENVGPTLDSALSLSWTERVQLSLKLIRMSREFTRTSENLALYMYDVTLGNFAIDNNGNVKLIDCEHILIVDMRKFNKDYDIKSNDSCASDTLNCLTFVPNDLCNGQSQDHNYYAICRNILSRVGAQKGLLHTPPNSRVFNSTFLTYLLDNCINSVQMSREHAIEKLESELSKLIN